MNDLDHRTGDQIAADRDRAFSVPTPTESLIDHKGVTWEIGPGGRLRSRAENPAPVKFAGEEVACSS